MIIGELTENKMNKEKSMFGFLGKKNDIKEILKVVGLEKEKVRHRIMNKKQLETFSSLSLWGGG